MNVINFPSANFTRIPVIILYQKTIWIWNTMTRNESNNAFSS